MAGVALFLALVATQPTAPTALRGDPLDPLTGSELIAARNAIAQAGRLTSEMRFGALVLREPPKEAVLAQRRSGAFGRTALAHLFDWGTSTAIRAHIDIRRSRVIRWDTLPTREPPMRIMIRRRLEEVLGKDPRWRAALARRGIPDPALVSPLGALGESASIPWEDGRRVITAYGYDQEAFPPGTIVPGLRARVDLTRGIVLELGDTPPAGGDSAVSPMTAVVPNPEPAGKPFVINGTQLVWKNWRLRFGMHPRRGLELWDVAWIEAGRPRGVLYRASVSEAMAVYGDPGYSIWYPRDAGNEGLGNAQINSAVHGDAPEGAAYVDAVMPDDFGRPVTQPRAIAVYERDGGTLWRHSRRAVRARQLVLSSHATIDNYDFVFNWILGEDGAIDVEVNLTGLMLLYRSSGGRTGPTASHEVAPGILAPSHQHFFSYRLDFDVEGPSPNRVIEVETRPVPRRLRDNPEGLWFFMDERVLGSELEAIRQLNPGANRFWKVINPGRSNSLNHPVGFAVIPGISAASLSHPRSVVRRQATFLDAQLFATPFHRDELHAGGEFQNMGPRQDGVAWWSRQDRSLLDADVVLWYTLGVTHIPRPEEYPVMPVARAGFRIIPSGFFNQNPALDP